MKSAAALTLAWAATLGSHGDAGAQTTWLCGLTVDAVRLVCVPDVDPLVASDGPPATTAVVHGTRFPLDPRGPWVVDLWSPPDDPERVDLLARATICYRSPGCEVVLAWSPARRQYAQR